MIGALPPGLTLNASTGAISGTPTTPGLYRFTVTITNGSGLSASSPCSITISLPPCTVTSATGCLFLRNVVVPADVGSNTSGKLTLNGVISFRTDCLGGCGGGPGTASGIGTYTISGGGAPSSGTFTITGSQGSAFIGRQPPWGATCSAAVSSGFILLDVTSWFTDGSTGTPTWGDIAVNTSPSFSPGIGAGIGAQSFQGNSLAGVTISC